MVDIGASTSSGEAAAIVLSAFGILCFNEKQKIATSTRAVALSQSPLLLSSLFFVNIIFVVVVAVVVVAVVSSTLTNNEQTLNDKIILFFHLSRHPRAIKSDSCLISSDSFSNLEDRREKNESTRFSALLVFSRLRLCNT